jgi:hypothetical protein
VRDVVEEQLIESQPVPHEGHIGLCNSRGVRNDLSGAFPSPRFCHFATDIQGMRLVSDAGPRDERGPLFLARLQEPGQGPFCEPTYLMRPRSSWRKTVHVHPFLSPDGSKAFFNSDESGVLQAYMIAGLDNL